MPNIYNLADSKKPIVANLFFGTTSCRARDANVNACPRRFGICMAAKSPSIEWAAMCLAAKPNLPAHTFAIFAAIATGEEPAVAAGEAHEFHDGCCL